ncbi:ABC transporter permease subunit [Bremerella sp. P1]|uniref:ABC transporter permease subunit n=1 Tax=Bremerella sp. P1 TaxID=3026424 RepID=UPI0023686DFE|nr:ABC transporter permease subunit [Bremerella sp. P1]WDI43474.1 ABC transporter permease [Bremerella sp. P1]
MFIGPVFTREAAVTPRRSKFYVYRAVYVAALFLLMCTAWLVLAGTQVIASVGDMARFGASIFHILAPIQLCLVIFFAAFSAAGAVAQEKDRKTLILLLMTRLNNSELVLGKMLASLINVFALIMAAAPVFCALFLFGGVSAGQVFRVLLVTFITALAAGSIGSTIALWREKTFQTLALTAMLVTVLLGFSVVVSQRVLFDRLLGISAADWATAINPIWAVMEAANPFPAAEGNLASIGGVIGLHVLIMSFGIVIMNGIAIALVRVWNPSREARRGKEMEAKQLEESIWGAEHDMAKLDEAADQNAANEQRRSGHVDARTTEVKIDHRQVWENPILWRETQTWAYGRKVLIIKFVYLALALAATYMLYSMVAAGTAVYRGDQLGTTIPPIAWGIVPLYLISLVIVNALAVTSVTNERDGQALDLLLVTDLTPKEFTFGKLWGVMWVTREMILAPLAVTAYLWIAGAMQLDSFIFVSAGLVVMYFFVTMLGLHCGMTYANSRTAIGVSLGTVFFLFLGVITCILLMISFTESFHFQLFPFLGFVAGGGLGLYVAIGHRNPSPAILTATLLLPGISFFAIVSFLLGKGFEVALATALAYGFTTIAMLIPAISQFDIEVGRRSGNDED